jgi:hypothetical protein
LSKFQWVEKSAPYATASERFRVRKSGLTMPPPGCRDGNRRYSRKTGMRSRPCAVSYRKPNTRQAFWQAVCILRRERLKQLSRCIPIREHGRIYCHERMHTAMNTRLCVCACVRVCACARRTDSAWGWQNCWDKPAAKRGTGRRIWSAGFRFALEPLCPCTVAASFFFSAGLKRCRPARCRLPNLCATSCRLGWQRSTVERSHSKL